VNPACTSDRGERQACPLCGTQAAFFAEAGHRPIWACPCCDLRFVPAAHHPSPEQARQRYLLHRNSRTDEGYVRWLGEAVTALARHAPSGSDGAALTVLDYGCGPAPVLVDLLREAGLQATGYDPFFAPDADLAHPFDAVVSVETFEHFRNPRADIGRVVALLKPGGVLVVRTSLHAGRDDMAAWHYALDNTHVSFYSLLTFHFCARQWGLRMVADNGRNLVVLERQTARP
jgi:SAM-dependent methyltransferase